MLINYVFNFVCLINFWLIEWQTLLDWLLLKEVSNEGASELGWQ
jgi:hypothetical protein